MSQNVFQWKKSRLLISLLVVTMYVFFQRVIDQADERREISETREAREAREAEEIFANNMGEFIKTIKRASVHCDQTLKTHKPFDPLVKRAKECLSSSIEGPFVVQLNIELRETRWVTVSIKGSAPLISPEIHARCIRDVIKSAPLSAELRGALEEEARREKPMWPALKLEISRTHEGARDQSELAFCTESDDVTQIKVEGMSEIRDQPHVVGQPAHKDKVYQDLKRCDQHLDPARRSSATLFRYARAGRSNELPKEYRCVPARGDSRATLDEASACLCQVIQSHMQQEAMIPIKITSTTPDGREVTSEGKVQSVPVRYEYWVARVPGAERPRFYELPALD